MGAWKAKKAYFSFYPTLGLRKKYSWPKIQKKASISGSSYLFPTRCNLFEISIFKTDFKKPVPVFSNFWKIQPVKTRTKLGEPFGPAFFENFSKIFISWWIFVIFFFKLFVLMSYNCLFLPNQWISLSKWSNFHKCGQNRSSRVL